MSARLSIPTRRPSCTTGSWCRPLSAMRPIAALNSDSGATVFNGTGVMMLATGVSATHPAATSWRRPASRCRRAVRRRRSAAPGGHAAARARTRSPEQSARDLRPTYLVHEAADCYAAQCLAHHLLMASGFGRAIQKPANERNHTPPRKSPARTRAKPHTTRTSVARASPRPVSSASGQLGDQSAGALVFQATAITLGQQV